MLALRPAGGHAPIVASLLVERPPPEPSEKPHRGIERVGFDVELAGERCVARCPVWWRIGDVVREGMGSAHIEDVPHPNDENRGQG